MRVIRYIIGTLHLLLILRAKILSVIKWWVDASFAADPDCKDHTGAMMYIGSGSIMELSRKQKINGRSSMESDIVGAYYALPQCLWSRYFIEGQGYAMEELDFHQDNMSAMLTENNGKESRTKRTKHIRVRYLFINDRIENGDLSLKYFLTG